MPRDLLSIWKKSVKLTAHNQKQLVQNLLIIQADYCTSRKSRNTFIVTYLLRDKHAVMLQLARGGGGMQRPVLHIHEPEKMGVRSA
jgi:hypothetical protein